MNSPTWMSDDEPPLPKISAMGWVRIMLRGLPLATVTFGGLILLLLIRLVERPVFGARRPITPKITQFVCRFAFVALQMDLRIIGKPMEGVGVAVANHSSWLDIFALNAHNDIYFVAKSEVANWAAIGWLARATGTLFIVRDRSQAVKQTKVFQERLKSGHRLLFFPEGTSTDGRRVLPFKPTLFQSFLSDELKDEMQIQPISLAFHAPDGEDARFYGWWGDSDFITHLIKALAYKSHGYVEVIYHAPIAVKDYANRKELARVSEDMVASALPWVN